MSKAEDNSDIPKIELPIYGFVSELPPDLLEGKTKAQVWQLEKLMKVDNFIEWAGPILVDINKHQRITNGRVNLHDEQIEANTKTLADLEIHSRDAKEVIDSAKITFKLVRNKYFWGAIVIVFVFVLPWVTKHAPSADDLIKKLFSS